MNNINNKQYERDKKYPNRENKTSYATNKGLNKE